MDPQQALQELNSTQTLSILTLSQPYLTPASPTNNITNKRSSNSSTNSDRSNATPAILAADLAHYQDLFSKLRFSYVEQVTKERFLRAITAEQPEFVDPAQNGELEETLKVQKAQLKEKKVEVRELVRELEEQGRSLAARYQDVQLQTQQLATLPSEIAHLEETIAQLREQRGPRSDNPALTLPLQPTLELLNDREEELASLDRQVEALRAALPHKQAQVSALQDEVSILNAKKIRAVEEAVEARRGREGGSGVVDEVEERGRWLRGVEQGLRVMLEA